MTVREILISEYQSTIALAQINSELKRALKTYERVPIFIDNLVKQFGTNPGQFSEFQIRQAANSMTNYFIQMVTKKANERIMSDLEKRRVQTEAYQREEVENKIKEHTKNGTLIIDESEL